MSDVSQWDVDAASNNSASPDGFPEGMAPSGLNNSAREVMAAVARWYEQLDNTLTTGGSSNAYTISTNNLHAALADIGLIIAEANHANTGAATLNVDTLGAVSIKKHHDQALISGDIEIGQILVLLYDGTNFQLLNPAAQVDANLMVFGSDAQGDLAYYNGSQWTRLAAGNSGEFLQTLGSGSNPQWATASGGTSAPFTDTTSIVKGSVDDTKQVRIEADTNITTGTVRVWTAPDQDLDLTPIFASGDVVLTYGAAAPSGWTADTTYNDRVLRIVNAAGVATGGSASINGGSVTSGAGSSHTHSVSITSGTPSATTNLTIGGGGTVASNTHTHTVSGDTGAEAAHTHTVTYNINYLDVFGITKD